jgi:hypothetical protein
MEIGIFTIGADQVAPFDCAVPKVYAADRGSSRHAEIRQAITIVSARG